MDTSSFDKLKEHLREMFHYNENDLDFGVFKLLRLKKNEIERFIEGDSENSLEVIVNKTLSEITQNQKVSQKVIVENFIKEKGGADEQSLLYNISDNHDEILQFVNYKNPQ